MKYFDIIIMLIVLASMIAGSASQSDQLPAWIGQPVALPGYEIYDVSGTGQPVALAHGYEIYDASGTTIKTLQKDQFDIKYDTHMVGVESRAFDCSDVNNCIDECARDPNCRYFDYTQSDKQCSLLRNLLEPSGSWYLSSGEVSGSKKAAAAPTMSPEVEEAYARARANFEWDGSTNYVGNDYQNIKSSEGDCYLACSNDAKCDGFTYVYPTQTCWLKNNIRGKNPDDKCFSGTKIVTKRISGEKFFTLDKKDDADKAEVIDGFLYVEHDPGCSFPWSQGNSGSDRFFTNDKPLPPGCTIVNYTFSQIGPNYNDWEAKQIIGDFAIFGKGVFDAASGDYTSAANSMTNWIRDYFVGVGNAGKFETTIVKEPNKIPYAWIYEGWGHSPEDLKSDTETIIHFENSCSGPARGKKNIYVISFNVRGPAGADLGE